MFQSTLEIVNKGGYIAPSGIVVRFDNHHNGKTLQDNVFCDAEANGYALLDLPCQVNFVAVAANNIRRFMKGRTTFPDNFRELYTCWQ